MLKQIEYNQVELKDILKIRSCMPDRYQNLEQPICSDGVEPGTRLLWTLSCDSQPSLHLPKAANFQCCRQGMTETSKLCGLTKAGTHVQFERCGPSSSYARLQMSINRQMTVLGRRITHA